MWEEILGVARIPAEETKWRTSLRNAAGGSSVPSEGAEGKKIAGGAADTSEGGRKSVRGDGGGGKHPPRHSGDKKRRSTRVEVSGTEDEEDARHSVLLPGKKDKWWLRERKFDFHHQGMKMKRHRFRVKKRSRAKSKGKNSADAGGHDLRPQEQSTSEANNAVHTASPAAVNKETVETPTVPGKKKEVSTGEVPKVFEEAKKPPQEKKPAKEENEHWEFSDSEISSDEEKDNLSATDDHEGQLDSEWLLRFEERRSRRSKTKRKLNESSEGKKLPSETNFLSVMLPLYRVMTLCGCFPFKIVRSSDGSPLQFQFVRKSKEYAACVVSFFLFGLASVFMTRNLILIILQPPPYTIYDQVLAIEFDKFWSDAVILLLWFYFLAISNAALLIRGNNVAEFLNRWLEALTLIRYNATRGLRRFLVTLVISMFIVDAYNVGDFIVERGNFRGSRGFIGLLIIDRFHNRVRLSVWPYRVAEYLGLFFHLYYSFCSTTTLLLISAHAWTIDNAARRFNLRLGLSLGILKPADVPFELRKMVRWKKLFAEYIVVTSFPKMLGKTFLVTLNALFAFLMCLMVMSLYGLFSEVILASPETDNEKEYFNVSDIAKLREGDFVPVKNRLSLIGAFSKELYSVGLIWAFAFGFLELLNRPGSTIMSGSRFVFRKGLVDCRSLVQRRFVASMVFSYATRARSHVRPGFPIDRNFIWKFLTFAFGVFMIFIEFSPQQLQQDTTVICDVFGGCRLIIISRFGVRVAHNKPAYTWHLQPIEWGARVPTTPPKLMPIGNIPEVLFTPPCKSEGSRPKEWPEFATQNQCDESSTSPVYYQLSLFQLTKRRYARIPFDCGEKSVSPSAGEVFDCFGEIVDLNVIDECGNYFIPTPDLLGDPQDPEMQVSVLEVEGSEGARVFCCFVYEQLESQAEVCNLPEKSRGRCKKSQTGMEAMDASFLELWRSSGGGVDLTLRKRWASCLCQGIGGVAILEDACINLDKPLITTTTTPMTTTTTTTTKPATCTPDFFRKKMCDCGDKKRNSQVFRSSLLKRYCTNYPETLDELRLGMVKVENNIPETVVVAGGPGFLDSCNVNRELHPRYPPASSNDTLYDCFGNLVSPVSFKDDCGNPKIAFPNSEGEETVPEIRVAEVDREDLGPQGTRLYFVCCWDYSGLYAVNQTDVCGSPKSAYEKNCAVRTKVVQSTQQEEESEDSCLSIFDSENVNRKFWDQCETKEPNPCDQTYKGG